MDDDDCVDAQAVAVEYCLWAAEQGLSPAELLATFGDEVPPSDLVQWQTVVEVVARVWRRL